MATPNYDLLFGMFGEINFLKLFGVGVLAMSILISLWMAMSSDGKKIIIAIFSAIGWGFLLGGLIGRIGGKK
jgi:hypothetical protein